ncbi:MAG: glycosyltransferase family 39 protein [Chloroflexota bacterium]|nr:glycosyltransferase family 39 protein [Chloroflexota bacterium]MBI5702031.1 glycosyltransferase family 39 protein [Chloroflexota bacterium]
MNSENQTNRKAFFNRIKAQPLTAILFVSVVLRVIVAFLMGNQVVELPGIFDQVSYHNLALRLLGGHGFTFGELWWPLTRAGEPTAHWSFPYTLYLTGVYALFGVYPLAGRILQAIIVGVLHPYITWRIGEKIFGRNVALIAAAIVSIYIYYVYYGAALMTEPFYITGILFSLYFAMQLAENADRKRDLALGLALGISLGLTVTLRQVFLLFLPFLFLWMWIVRFRLRRSLPLLPTALSFALILSFVLPITLFNYARFHRFVLLNTNSGYAFFWGNHPLYGTKFIPILSTPEYQAMIPEEVRHLDEAALDSELLKRGIQFVVQDPKRYVLLSLSRIPPYFMFWYSSESSTLSNISRIGSFGVFLPFMLYGLVLGVRKKPFWSLVFSPQGLLLLFALVYSGVHILTWTLIRYRLPVDAVMIPFAALALHDLAQRLSVKFPVFQRLINVGE